MKEAVDLGPFHLEALAISAKHSGAGVALAGNDVAVLHHWKLASELANASAYLHWAAVNFEETHRGAEVGTWGHWRGQKDGARDAPMIVTKAIPRGMARMRRFISEV